MRELGEYLKREREKRQISLSKVAEETKIPTRYLQALERGEVELLPGEVYVKGFLRSYAQEIGLDDQEVLDRYRQLTQKQTEQLQQQAAGQVSHKKKKKVSWHLRYERAFVTALLLVLLIVAILAAFIDREKETPTPPPKPKVSRQEPEVSEPQSPPAAAAKIELFARDNCWVEAYSQGERLFAVMMNPGDKKEIISRKDLALLLGKPAAMNIKRGQDAIDGLGKETVTVVFDQKGNYQIHRGRREEFFK